MGEAAKQPRLPRLSGEAELALSAAGLTAFAARDHEAFEPIGVSVLLAPDTDPDFDITQVAID